MLFNKRISALLRRSFLYEVYKKVHEYKKLQAWKYLYDFYGGETG